MYPTTRFFLPKGQAFVLALWCTADFPQFLHLLVVGMHDSFWSSFLVLIQLPYRLFS